MIDLRHTPWMWLQMAFWWTVCRFHKAQWAFIYAWRRWDSVAADPRIQFLILMQAISRGSNYITDPPEVGSANTLSLTEQALPLWAWGCLYMTFATMGIIGLRCKRWPLLQIAHFAVGAVYLSFAFGATVEYFSDTTSGNYRTGSGFFILALVYFIFARKAEKASRRARLEGAE